MFGPCLIWKDLAADAAHGALGLNEVFFADVVASFFLPDDSFELSGDIGVGGAGAERSF